MSRRLRIARGVALVALGVLAVWVVYRSYIRESDFVEDVALSPLLLPTLSLALVILALGLVGVIIRNLVRLIVERKRGLLGARLRTKLVFFFLALVLLPATVLFIGTAQVIKQTVEAILRTPLEDLTRQSREIVNEWSDYFESQSLRRAEAIAAELRGSPASSSASAAALLERWARLDEAQVIRVSRGGEVVAQAGGLPAGAAAVQVRQLEELSQLLADDAAQARESRVGIEYLGEGLLVHAAAPVESGADPPTVVSVGIVLPTRLVGSLEGIVRADQAYRQFRANRRELVRVYVTVIGLIFLVTIFIATWLGFYLSRRITEPIRALADATREIATGNLGVRVDTEVGDEMGTLVEAFNEMAAELQENREVITRSTAELRRSNRELDARRRYIETLLANISTAVVSLDPSGRITTVNPATERILGTSLTVGDDASAVFRFSGLLPLAELLDESEHWTKEGVRRDLVLERDDGRINVSVQVSGLRDGTDDRTGTLLMVEDLTELLQAQRASAWREVARRIAHEIKNPLTPIQLAAQRLRKKFSEGADLENVIPGATESIEREVGALKRLVDEFSRFARMPEVAPQEVELARVIDSVLELYKGLPRIRWEVDVAGSIGRVTLDPEQIRRVLINLIDNAVAAMSGEGTIRIGADLTPGERRLRIEVSDTGPGIGPRELDKMFSPYFSTKRRGTGLGLAIVHRVITDHHGTIQVENNQPTGARFVIEIPA
jgi:two-component system nitrogen regulation sensor histidine kinase NtrY